MSAAYTLVRLPLTVKPVFLEWLDRTLPDSRERIENLIRDTHGGKLNNSQFGERMRGSGEIAEQIRRVFHVFAARYKPRRRPARLRPHALPPAATGERADAIVLIRPGGRHAERACYVVGTLPSLSLAEGRVP